MGGVLPRSCHPMVLPLAEGESAAPDGRSRRPFPVLRTTPPACPLRLSTGLCTSRLDAGNGCRETVGAVRQTGRRYPPEYTDTMTTTFLYFRRDTSERPPAPSREPPQHQAPSVAGRGTRDERNARH